MNHPKPSLEPVKRRKGYVRQMRSPYKKKRLVASDQPLCGECYLPAYGE